MAKLVKYCISTIRLILFKIRYLNNSDIIINVGLSKEGITYIGSRAEIVLKGMCKLTLGKNVYLSNDTKLECNDGVLEIGNNCFFNRNCNVAALKKITIGDECIFGPNVGIYDHDHCFSKVDLPIREQGFIKKTIKIGSNVWVGSNTIITSGVKIGDRVVVAANSVVTKDLESNGLYGGVPVKLIKKI